MSKWTGVRRQSAIDRFLNERDLKRKAIAKDGSCLFRAVAEQVWQTQSSHWTLRRHCARHIKNNKAYFKSFLTIPVDDYCWKLSNSVLWGGEMELVALSQLLNRTIIVYSEEEKGGVNVKEYLGKKTCVDDNSIMLAYTGSNHYDTVWKETDERSTAVCQSLLYELLMETVLECGMHHSMRHRVQNLRSRDLHEDYGRDRELSKYPLELLKALSHHLYSNISLEVASRERRSREMKDQQLAARLQFKVGDKCHVKLDDNIQPCEIDSISNGQHIKVKVYLTQSRKQITVPVKDIMLQSGSTQRKQGRQFEATKKKNEGKTNSKSQKSQKTTKENEASLTTTSVKKAVTTSHSSNPAKSDGYIKPGTILPTSVTTHPKVKGGEPLVGSDGITPSPPSCGDNVSPPTDVITEDNNETPVTSSSGYVPPVESHGHPISFSFQPPPTDVRWSDTTIHMSSLMGHVMIDASSQNQLTSITEAPECEWPILNPVHGGYSKDTAVSSTFHIDGPPPVNDTTAGNQFPPFMYSTNPAQFVIHEMDPPLHLLRTSTIESRQQFLFEFAQKCLRIYTKYVTDPLLEDSLSDLQCMTLEEFTSSSQYNDGQFSITTSYTSRAESEVTEEEPTLTAATEIKKEQVQKSGLTGPSSPTSPSGTMSPSVTHEDTPPPKEGDITLEAEDSPEEKMLLPPQLMPHPVFPYPPMYPMWMPGAMPWFPVPYGMPPMMISPQMMMPPRPPYLPGPSPEIEPPPNDEAIPQDKTPITTPPTSQNSLAEGSFESKTVTTEIIEEPSLEDEDNNIIPPSCTQNEDQTSSLDDTKRKENTSRQNQRSKRNKGQSYRSNYGYGYGNSYYRYDNRDHRRYRYSNQSGHNKHNTDTTTGSGH